MNEMIPLVTVENVLNLYKSKLQGRESIESRSSWFPIFASPQLAGVVADLMCDGNLQGDPKWRFDFTSKNISELERFRDVIFNLFGVKGKIRLCVTNKFGKTFNFGVNCKLLGRILYLTGVPPGCKVKKEFLVPKWIIEDEECFRAFIKRVFDCEGCVSVEGNGSFIDLGMSKAENLIENGIRFFEQIKKALKDFFEIETTNIFLLTYVNIRKDGIRTRVIKLRIKRLQSLINFWREIGFDNPVKQNKLKTILAIRNGAIEGTVPHKVPYAQSGRAIEAFAVEAEDR